MSAPVPDGGTGHTAIVTDAPDPVAAALAERDAHKRDCAACRDVLPCTRLPEFTAAWRRALRYAPLNHAPASGQAREVPR